MSKSATECETLCQSEGLQQPGWPIDDTERNNFLFRPRQIPADIASWKRTLLPRIAKYGHALDTTKASDALIEAELLVLREISRILHVGQGSGCKDKRGRQQTIRGSGV